MTVRELNVCVLCFIIFIIYSTGTTSHTFDFNACPSSLDVFQPPQDFIARLYTRLVGLDRTRTPTGARVSTNVCTLYLTIRLNYNYSQIHAFENKFANNPLFEVCSVRSMFPYSTATVGCIPTSRQRKI